MFHTTCFKFKIQNSNNFFDFEKKFTDLPVEYIKGLAIPNNITVSPLGFSYIDYDKDGDFDIVTASTPDYGGFIIQLCENLGNRKFSDVTKQKINRYTLKSASHVKFTA